MTAASEGRFRVEQDPLVRGHGQFLDDVKLSGMRYAAFVRSPYAHARIKHIATDNALRLPGAIAVLTPDDLLPHVHPAGLAFHGERGKRRRRSRYGWRLCSCAQCRGRCPAAFGPGIDEFARQSPAALGRS